MIIPDTSGARKANVLSGSALGRIAGRGLFGHTLRSATAALAAYFKRQLTKFETPLVFNRGSAFRRGVWDALLRIPYGHTCSYVDVARQIGQPSAMRAVGAANAANPIAIIVPCHRVIGAKGALVGFGGGLHTKRKLLELEGVFLPLS